MANVVVMSHKTFSKSLTHNLTLYSLDHNGLKLLPFTSVTTANLGQSVARCCERAELYCVKRDERLFIMVCVKERKGKEVVDDALAIGAQPRQTAAAQRRFRELVHAHRAGEWRSARSESDLSSQGDSRGGFRILDFVFANCNDSSLLFCLNSLASQSTAKVEGTKDGGGHGGWKGQEEEVVQGKES
jgi:hypothetical protein